jgi:Transglycosylase-like domain
VSRRSRRERRRRRRIVWTLVAVAVTGMLGAGALAGIAAATDEPETRSALRRAPVVIEPALISASKNVQARLAVQELARAIQDRAVLERALAEKAQRDSIWDRIAACETQGNWSMRGSSFSGGVGFSNAAWDQWGGRQFAPNAGQATRDEQIIVAERIRASVGLGAWGCAKTLGLTRR